MSPASPTTKAVTSDAIARALVSSSRVADVAAPSALCASTQILEIVIVFDLSLSAQMTLRSSRKATIFW